MHIDKCAYCGEIVTDSDGVKECELYYHKDCLEKANSNRIKSTKQSEKLNNNVNGGKV